jgi:hypothetical protein
LCPLRYFARNRQGGREEIAASSPRVRELIRSGLSVLGYGLRATRFDLRDMSEVPFH